MARAAFAGVMPGLIFTVSITPGLALGDPESRSFLRRR